MLNQWFDVSEKEIALGSILVVRDRYTGCIGHDREEEVLALLAAREEVVVVASSVMRGKKWWS